MLHLIKSDLNSKIGSSYTNSESHPTYLVFGFHKPKSPTSQNYKIHKTFALQRFPWHISVIIFVHGEKETVGVSIAMPSQNVVSL